MTSSSFVIIASFSLVAQALVAHLRRLEVSRPHLDCRCSNVSSQIEFVVLLFLMGLERHMMYHHLSERWQHIFHCGKVSQSVCLSLHFLAVSIRGDHNLHFEVLFHLNSRHHYLFIPFLPYQNQKERTFLSVSLLTPFLHILLYFGIYEGLLIKYFSNFQSLPKVPYSVSGIQIYQKCR